MEMLEKWKVRPTFCQSSGDVVTSFNYAIYIYVHSFSQNCDAPAP